MSPLLDGDSPLPQQINRLMFEEMRYTSYTLFANSNRLTVVVGARPLADEYLPIVVVGDCSTLPQGISTGHAATVGSKGKLAQ